MPAKPLTPEQQADAARLKGVWATFKLQNPDATQEWLADMCGWRTQGTVNQYLHGKIPLNLRAVLKFAAVLGVEAGAISPSLAADLSEATRVSPRATTIISPAFSRLLKVLEGLDDDEILSIAKALEVLRGPRDTKAASVRKKPGGTSKRSR